MPGALGVFTDEASVAKLEVSMAKTGFLPADNMAKTFNMMRGNDLIWNYVVNNWMKGEDPPAFDLLTWNADSTRMPAEMHSFYLRSCYLENQLARGVMEIAGETLNIKSVDQDLYFLAAEQDHIAPWRSSYTGARLPSGDVRFVLSNSGHIAGIVNPPNPKSKHYVGPDGELPENPDEWLAAATMHPDHLVGGLGDLDRAARRQADQAAHAREARSTRPWATPPEPTSTAPEFLVVTPLFGSVSDRPACSDRSQSIQSHQHQRSLQSHSPQNRHDSASTVMPFVHHQPSICQGSTMSEFSVSKAIITGGAQGIGFSIAHRLSTEGLTVSVLDINESRRQGCRGEDHRRHRQPRLSVSPVTSPTGPQCTASSTRPPRPWAAWTPTSATPASPGTRCSTS